MPKDKKVKKLSQKQRLELRQVFDLFDIDRSGEISIEEFKQALWASISSIKDIFISSSLNMLFDLFGRNGKTDFEEFVEIIADVYFRKFSKADILETFKRFDHDNNGFITANELQTILSRFGQKFSNNEVIDGPESESHL
ncbi:unnamed protein product, partial [Didymodactylos carnosus]